MFVLRRCVAPRDFGDVSVNHSRTGAVKLLITRRDEQSSKLLRGTVRRTTACPRRPQLGCDPAPAQKDDSTLRLAYSALELSPWAMPAHAGGEPWTPGPSRVAPPRPISSIAAMYLCWQRYCAAISGALSTRPNVDGVAGRIQRSELLHRVTPCGPE